MSAIAGIVRFDDGPVKKRELERVAAALKQFGPDRSGIALEHRVGFAHTLMRMTPEDSFDRQPLSLNDGVMLVADLRIDNRDEIIRRFALDCHAARDWSDSRLLMGAWEMAGDDVWRHIRGPFAAAIWDPHRRSLTLARDHLGLNVVMWFKTERFLAFSSMPGGLFAFDAIPRAICEEKFADFMVLNHADHATTIYKDVYRVPPGHVLQVAHDGNVRCREYWSIAQVPEIRLGSDEDYADGLRDRLDMAVRRQMRSAHPVGSLLSGGLDSSSVTMLAARALHAKNQRLVAFSAVPREGYAYDLPPGSFADPRPFVEAVQQHAGNIDIEYVCTGDCDDFAEIDRFFLTMNAPVRNPCTAGWSNALLRRAFDQRRRVVLGGLFGNYTVSWDGWSQSAGHLRRGKLLRAYRQWRQFYRSTPFSRWVAFRKLLLEPSVPSWAAVWADRKRRPRRIAPWQDHAPIRPAFAMAMNVDQRARRNGHDFLYRMHPREREISLTQIDYFGDWNAAEKALTGVEVRDPTADIDVVSYCFGIPPQQYLVGGIDRSLIRRAMWGIVPEQVLTNRRTGMQSADWHEKLELRRSVLAAEISQLAQSKLVQKIIDVPRLEAALSGWPKSGWHTAEIFREYNLALSRGVSAARFLRWFESSN